MTNKEIIEQLKSLKSHCEDFRDGEDSVWAKDVEALDAAIEALEKQVASEWIPVSEKLPEESGTYIVNAIENCIVHVTFAKWMKRMKKWNLTGSRSYWKVTAWQPLPEPYKGESE